jgi:peroxiredoxin
MRSIPLLSAMLLGSIGTFAGNPVATTTLNVKVGITPEYNGFMQFNCLTSTSLSVYASEIFFVAKDKPLANFSRPLSAGKQIVFLNNCPILVNTGDQVQVVMSPRYKNGKVVINQFSPAITGKDAARQGLPYLIDSLYTAGEEITTIEQMDAFISTHAQQVKGFIAKAKVTDNENLAILNAYEQTKLLYLKYMFQESHKNLLPSAAYGDWCLKDFDFGTPAFSALGDNAGMQQIVGIWWAARKMQDSTLKEDFRLPEVLMRCKSELVKGTLATYTILGEARVNGYTQKLKSLFAMTQSSLSSTAPAKPTIDSLYKAYHQLEVGEPAFNFALKNDKGDIVRLSDFKGKVVIIDVWATWCTGCVASLPTYNKIKDSYKDKNDIVFLTIGWESPDAVDYWKEFSEKKEIAGEHNLFLSSDRTEEQCKQFVERYCLTGVTRWMAVNEEGKMLNGNLGYPTDPAFTQRIANCYKMKN